MSIHSSGCMYIHNLESFPAHTCGLLHVWHLLQTLPLQDTITQLHPAVIYVHLKPRYQTDTRSSVSRVRWVILPIGWSSVSPLSRATSPLAVQIAKVLLIRVCCQLCLSQCSSAFRGEKSGFKPRPARHCSHSTPIPACRLVEATLRCCLDVVRAEKHLWYLVGL